MMTTLRLPLRYWFSVFALLLSLCALPAALAQAPVKYDSGTISGLTARNIGSATMGGRIAAIDAVDENGKITVFAGSASGGVWKSINGATTFKPVFDREPVQSIGAVTIDHFQSQECLGRNGRNAGPGTACPSAMEFTNRPMAARTGQNMGLKDSERIARILVDPKDSNTVYACATGHLWNDNDERGVYKTTDGGTTWKKVLAGANGSTGCAMLAANPQEPKTIYASMWDFRRQGWTFRSGGPGSGLFKSTDGGDHWTEIASRQQPGTPGKTIRKNCAGCSSFQAERGLRHDRIQAERALPL